MRSPLLPEDRRPEPRTPGLGRAYNAVRPHQALAYLAPAQFPSPDGKLSEGGGVSNEYIRLRSCVTASIV